MRISFFNSNAGDIEIPVPLATLQLGGATLFGIPTFISQNVLVKNCVFSNNPVMGIFSDFGNTGITVSDCVVDSAQDANIIFFGTNSSVVEYSKIQNSAGIGFVLSDSAFNVVNNNTFTSNTGFGVLLDPGTADNIVENNTLLNNLTPGIEDLGTGNHVINNTIFP